MNLIPHNTNIDFVGYRKIPFLVAIVIVVASLVSILTKGLNYGVDFKGGHIFEVRMPKNPNLEELRHKLESLNIGECVIQSFGDNQDLLIKVEKQDKDQDQVISKVKDVLGEGVDYRKIDTVGAKVGSELIQNGIKAIAFALLAMIIYIALRFEWQFSLCAIFALAHDCIAILGLFSLFPLEFNETAIIAILITAGYSINDTIVIFDRIRENIKKYKKLDLGYIINKSLNETLSRTTLTATTTLLAVLALYFFGGSIISTFSTPILYGIIVGSFSSICLAAPMLLNLKFKKQDDSLQKTISNI